LPEIWIPYGNVETLVTIQAENLGAVAEAPPEGASLDVGRVNELLKGSAALFICDSAPATLELLRGVAPTLAEGPGLKLYSASPKRVESGVPEVKGRVTTLPPPIPAGEGDNPVYSPVLSETGAKLFLGSAKPDPLFGILDARAAACLNWVARSHAIAARAEKGMEPEPFQKTEAYEAMLRMAEGIPESKYLSVVPRGGKPRIVLEDAPFDAVKNSFAKTSMAQTRGIVVGLGGRGYDDTLSSAIRGVWNVLDGVRRTGSILLIAECSEGAGSIALEMLITGRMSGDGERRREKYVDGLEDVFYLNKLKEEYDVLLLSGLPETYARSKLGLTTSKGTGEAVGRMLNKVGRSGKLNVVPRACECQVVSG
jgi:hypothetical protein